MKGCILTTCLIFVMEMTARIDGAAEASAQYNRGKPDRPYGYREAEFNEPCRTTMDCRSFGYDCENNRTCKCARYYIPDVHMRTCVGGVNQKCIYDEHCIEGAFCYNQEYCKCKDTSPYMSQDGLVCSGTDGYYKVQVPNVLFLIVFAGLLIK